jgi:RNA polymerase sigma factor (sigma-70 family)
LTREFNWELAQQGDLAEIERIVEKYYKVAYKIAHWWAKSGQIEDSEALGLSNIAIMKCIRKGTYDETRGIKFTSYLASAVNNEIRMFLRKERRIRDKINRSLDQPLKSDEYSSMDNITYGDVLADPMTLEALLDESYLLEDAIKALSIVSEELSEFERNCIWLSLNGNSVRRISQKLDQPQNQVRTALNAIKCSLRECYAEINSPQGDLYGHSGDFKGTKEK